MNKLKLQSKHKLLNSKRTVKMLRPPKMQDNSKKKKIKKLKPS